MAGVGPTLRHPVSMLRRSIWRIATVAALFALQGPWCDLACLAGSGVSLATDHDSEPSCHQEAPASPPAQAPAPHEGCGCELAGPEVPLPASSTAWGSLSLAVMTTGGLASPTPLPRVRVSSVPVAGDLPPPDILLLKSSLLI